MRSGVRKKYMEVNHIFLLSCSLEKLILVEWFFNHSTLSQCIVLIGGSLLEWGQLFLKEIEGDRGCNFTRLKSIFLVGNYLQGQLSREHLSGGQSSGEKSIRGEAIIWGQFSSEALVIEPSIK